MTMTVYRTAQALASMGLSIAAFPAAAQDFPQRQIEFVAGYGPGGGHDTMMRTMARIIEQEDLVDVPINVVNKDGGSSAVAMGYLHARSGDPHYLMAITSSHIATPLTTNIGLDYANFTPIARLGIDPELLVVNSRSEYETLNQLADAEGTLNVGGTATGSIEHIATMELAEATGLDLNYIPFQSDGEVVIALLSNQVDFVITNPGPVSDYIESEQFRALAISTEERIDMFPDVPTFVEQGVDITLSVFRGVTASPDISEQERAELTEIVTSLVETEAWQEQYVEPNAVVPLVIIGEEFEEYLAQTEQVYRKTLEELGMLDR